ncbi:MAG TPA: helix-turn-helix domain-containing protein [Chloroflexota bacterium]|nr:helix-turn-helix domain-containing protein [Chloroflexota bacterium]
MAMNDRAVDDLWDLTVPTTPPCSRLYCLAPIRIGTPGVESLTSYIARLALAHGVTVRRLVVKEILPYLGRPYLLNPQNTGLSAFFRHHNRALNGTGRMARDMVQVLDMLTRRTDLRFLTMQTWAEVVPSQGLLRRPRAWCPACYEEWHEAGQVIYEPLLWTLAPITACVRHQRRLQHNCPNPTCQRSLPVLGQRTRPGHCSACGGWLGSSAEPGPTSGDALTAEEVQAQNWVGEAIGELLAEALTLSDSPTRQRLPRVIVTYAGGTARGNLARLARDLDLSLQTVAQWRRGRMIPSLDMLLHTCHRLGTTPLHFLTDDLLRIRHAWGERPPRELAPLLDAPRRPPQFRRKFDVAQTRAALEAALASPEQPPPPMREVARRLGRAHSQLIGHLPELCHAISERYLAYQHSRGTEKRQRLCAEIQQAARQLHDQGIYPSAYRIAPLISQPGFVRDVTACVARKEVLRDLGYLI